jgi:predicted RNase H-like nuclease
MRAVLGIDAAWTTSQASGVALVAEKGPAWELLAVESSYQRFHAKADGSLPETFPSGSRPDAAALLASSATLCGVPVDLVAIDMPLAHGPIRGRRFSDNEVSRVFGARKCGTHTPSSERPGPISSALKEEFGRAGYPLQTDTISPPGMIEVYPHPALVELATAPQRLPYKVSKVRSYWPDATMAERRTLLFQEWDRITALLEAKIRGVTKALPIPLDPRGRNLKSYEDMLDAVVCAWVAICTLEGHAKPFGDQNSAIWIPSG